MWRGSWIYEQLQQPTTYFYSDPIMCHIYIYNSAPWILVWGMTETGGKEHNQGSTDVNIDKQNKHILIFQLLGYTERQILWHCWYPKLLSPFFAMEDMSRGGWFYTVHAGHTTLAVVTDCATVKLDANNNSHHWWWPPWWLSLLYTAACYPNNYS